MMVFGLEFWALTFEFTGKILIAVTVLLVHSRVRREHKIDKRVLKEMGKETVIGVLGIVLMLVGYLLHLVLIGV
jgi:hypothetical protein